MIRHAPFRPTRRRLLQAVAALVVLLAGSWAPLARAGQESHGKPGWGATWAASSNGVYPTGTAVFQPSLAQAFPSAATGANDQFGDSITDGTASTLNGDDRWPDVLARRLHAAYGNHVALVNAGIGGNRVTGPTDPLGSVAGGPGALVRMERDVFSLAGVSAIVWLEGINDLSGLVPPQDVIAGYREGVRMARERGIKVIAATVTSGLNLANPTEANLMRDADRKILNEFIRTAGIYDGVADFDAVTVDPATGALRPEMLPNSVSQAVDYLHPNRVG